MSSSQELMSDLIFNIWVRIIEEIASWEVACLYHMNEWFVPLYIQTMLCRYVVLNQPTIPFVWPIPFSYISVFLDT